MAMNEKFKKDEVWGHLGKGKEKDKTEGAEERATGHNLEGIEGQGLVANQKVGLGICCIFRFRIPLLVL